MMSKYVECQTVKISPNLLSGLTSGSPSQANALQLSATSDIHVKPTIKQLKLEFKNLNNFEENINKKIQPDCTVLKYCQQMYSRFSPRLDFAVFNQFSRIPEENLNY